MCDSMIGAVDAPLYFIVDLRAAWSRRPYITLWRPNFANYAYPLCWAGRYDRKTVVDEGDYLTRRRYSPRHDRYCGAWERFAVACGVVESIAIKPKPGMIDGDAGPVVPNTKDVRRYLISQRLQLPPGNQKGRSDD